MEFMSDQTLKGIDELQEQTLKESASEKFKADRGAMKEEAQAGYDAAKQDIKSKGPEIEREVNERKRLITNHTHNR